MLQVFAQIAGRIATAIAARATGAAATTAASRAAGAATRTVHLPGGRTATTTYGAGSGGHGGGGGGGGGGWLGAVKNSPWAQRTGRGLVEGAGMQLTQYLNGLARGVASNVLHFGEHSKALVEDRRSLAMFNGKIAQAMVELDLGRMMREKKLAGAVSGSTGELAKAVDRMEEAFQPLRETSATLGNAFRTLGTYVVAAGGWAASKVSDLSGISSFSENIERMLGNRSSYSPLGKDWSEFAWGETPEGAEPGAGINARRFGNWGGQRPKDTSAGWESREADVKQAEADERANQAAGAVNLVSRILRIFTGGGQLGADPIPPFNRAPGEE